MSLWSLLSLSFWSLAKATPIDIISPGTLSASQELNNPPSIFDCAADERSLLSIIWSCTLTIFLCTWVAVHPNIPHVKAKQWDIFESRVYLVLVGIISPEIIVLLAARQFYGIKRMVASFQEHGIRITPAQAHFIQMGGFMLHRGAERLGTINSTSIFRLMRRQRCRYRFWNIIRPAEVAPFRIPSDEEIWDCSKGDWITKTVGAAQVSWFVFQCGTRWVNGLDVTELELFTFALSVLNGVIYFLWWDKPVDIRSRESVIWIPTDAREASQELDTLDESIPIYEVRPEGQPWWKAPVNIWSNGKAIARFLSDQYTTVPVHGMKAVFIACTELGTVENQIEIVAISSLSAILFGGIHMVAWTGSFPTRLEQMVWRVCAILTTLIPIFPLIWRVRWQRDSDYTTRIMKVRDHELRSVVVLGWITYSLIPVYTSARLGLLFVAISSLRDSASGVRIEDHSQLLLPHF